MSSLRDSEFQRLTQRLLAAEQRAEEDRRARQQAEQDKQQAEQAQQQAEQRNQKTTLDEFLQACHEHLHKPLRVETNKSWTTKDPTNPGNRYYPKNLKK